MGSGLTTYCQGSSPPPTGADDLQPMGSPPTLETLPEDVFCLIAAESLRTKGSLCSLSQTSRRVRAACLLILFARCAAHPDGQKGTPPEGIRPYVQHVTYFNYKPKDQILVNDERRLIRYLQEGVVRKSHRRREENRGNNLDSCWSYSGPSIPIPQQPLVVPVLGVELGYFPALRSVSFRCTLKLSHLELMKKCLGNSSLKSIAFTSSVRWIGGHPDPRVDTPYPPNISITHLSHAPSVWREMNCDLEHRNVTTEIALESHCLALITLGISNTAEVLELPLETAPMARMSELAWPHLQELSLCGRYHLRSQSTSFPRLLSQTPGLRKLSVRVAQPLSLMLQRAPIFGKNPSPPIDLPELRTLILAYPDPDDAIFSISSKNLTHLALRDWPRYYFHQEALLNDVGRWACPLLTASECLRVLKRMSLYNLETLELAYLVDHADSALLRYIAYTFPHLTRLELHRYRQGSTVDHKHIAHVLTPLASLRVLHLHLDFPEMTGPRTSALRARGDTRRHLRWIAAAQTRGTEIADIMEARCPELEHVGILVHDASGSYWWPFRPSWALEGRVEHDRTKAEDDFEPMPVPWDKRGD